MTTWPYKHPFAELEKKEWPYNRTNAEEDLLQKSYFFDQKILKLFLAKKEWPCNRTNAEEDLLNKWSFRPKKSYPFTRPIHKVLTRTFESHFWAQIFLGIDFDSLRACFSISDWCWVCKRCHLHGFFKGIRFLCGSWGLDDARYRPDLLWRW